MFLALRTQGAPIGFQPTLRVISFKCLGVSFSPALIAIPEDPSAR